MDHVVVDVEIQKTIEETPGGWDATDKLGVAVACVWEYRTARMRVYGSEDVDALRKRLLEADRISGFNIFNFDFPVIWECDKQRWLEAFSGTAFSKSITDLKHTLRSRTDDMLRRIWQAKGLDPDRFDKATHDGVSLNTVVSATLNSSKIGFGGDAPKWYQAGQVQRVANYCADDVAIERDLTDFVDRYGYVLLSDRATLAVRKLPISSWRGA
jgi:DEAD/DEAH box helicase domain-containing protein